ncbi:MAG TPA: hypothetical protein VGB87_02185 [Vicinamibacteria bacterium]
MKTSVRCLAVALVALAAACSGGSRTGGLSVSARSSAPAGSATQTAKGLKLVNGITISRVRMAVRAISVEGTDPEGACSTAVRIPTPTSMPMASRGGSSGSGGAGSDDGGARGSGGSGSGSDDGPGEDDDCELAFGPFDVDLAGSALAGAVSFAFDAPIPAGTYHEIAIRLNTVPATLAAGNPVLEELAAAHASILVDGFVEEAPSTIRAFTFSTPMEVTQKREGTLVIGPGANVTLDFDPSGWFDGPGGRLDPAAPTNQGAILANIRASIRILKDDDHDGRDDDEHGHD